MARWVGNKKIIIMSATLSHNNTLALESIVSNLSGVVGNLVRPDMQGQATEAGFWSEKNTGYTDNNVAFVKGLCHVFKPRYMPELWNEWGKTNDIATGRNTRIKRTRMISMRTGIKIYSSIYIEKKEMEYLTKAKFNAGDLVTRFKYL